MIEEAFEDELFIEDEPTLEELVTQARDAYEAEGDESGEYWDIVWQLVGNRELETTNALLQMMDGDTFQRIFSTTILARLALTLHLAWDNSQHLTPTTIAGVLLEMVDSEQDETVLKTLVSSLSRHQEIDERIPPVLKRFYHHPNVSIRWCLAVGLDSYETSEAIQMLIALTHDEDTDIRHWATSNLETQVNIDSPEIRDALLARLSDENSETRVEALYGLAKRKDARVVPAVIREFNAGVSSELFDALATLPGYGLGLALQQMADDTDYEGDRAELQTAIEKCESYSQQYADE